MSHGSVFHNNGLWHLEINRRVQFWRRTPSQCYLSKDKYQELWKGLYVHVNCCDFFYAEDFIGRIGIMLNFTSKWQIFITWVNQFCLKIKVYPVTYLQAYWTISCEGWDRVLVLRFGRFWSSGGWIYLLLWVETIIRSCKINAPIPLLNNEWEWEFCEIEYFSHHSKWSQRFKSRGYSHPIWLNGFPWAWWSLGRITNDITWLSLQSTPSNLIKFPQEKIAAALPPNPNHLNS